VALRAGGVCARPLNTPISLFERILHREGRTMADEKTELLKDVLVVFGPARLLTDRDIARMSVRYPDPLPRPMDSWASEVRKKLMDAIRKELGQKEIGG
jgi:hypothetical protein